MTERQILLEVGWTVLFKMKCTAMSNIKQKTQNNWKTCVYGNLD